MQQRSMARALVALFVGFSRPDVAFAASANARSAEVVAQRWLATHPATGNGGDELGELKTENPEAYAIVKALLTKRALGLLDPKHPTASFAASAAQSTGTAVSAGAETDETEAPPRAPVPRRDWLNWKPPANALEDDATGLSGPAATVAAAAPVAPVVKSAPTALAAAATAETADTAAAAPQTSDPSENSYLRGAGLVARKTDEANSNALASFSWGDDAPAAPKAPTPPVPAQKPQQQNKATVSVLSKWLGVDGGSAPAPEAPAAVAAPRAANPVDSEGNPYTKGLW
eukprot:TRINITY_DN12088_c0_g1_i1.p1 TRINITY_DN12088_c0_g1~~TRINITY_DN12088_c0_g1_i1.p1  ORF type:complete len:332 (-),score=68.04 TRINITY_DN12088_c0_g1_i1:182-1042(-)